MNEFENVESGHQAESQVEETNEAVETVDDTAEQQPQQEAPAEPFLRVKYNKEERGLTHDEALSYAQKGMNYDKVQQQYAEMQRNVDRLAKLSGLDASDLFNQLDQLEKQQRQEQFENYGLDEEAFQQLVENSPLADDLRFARETRQEQEYQQFVRSQVDELIELFPDLEQKDIPTEVWEEAKQGRNLADAYLRHSHKNLRNQAEQSAIQKLKETQAAAPPSLSATDATQRKSISEMSDKEFRDFVEKAKGGAFRG